MLPSFKLQQITEAKSLQMQADAVMHQNLISYFHSEIHRLAAVFGNETDKEKRSIIEECIRQLREDIELETNRVARNKEWEEKNEAERQEKREKGRQIRAEIEALVPKYRDLLTKVLIEGKHATNPFVVELPDGLKFGQSEIKREAFIMCLAELNEKDPLREHRYCLGFENKEGIYISIL